MHDVTSDILSVGIEWMEMEMAHTMLRIYIHTHTIDAITPLARSFACPLGQRPASDDGRRTTTAIHPVASPALHADAASLLRRANTVLARWQCGCRCSALCALVGILGCARSWGRLGRGSGVEVGGRVGIG